MRRPGERTQPNGTYPREFSFNERELYAGTTPYEIYQGVDQGFLGQPPAATAAAYAQGEVPYSGGPIPSSVWQEPRPTGVGLAGVAWGVGGLLGVLWLFGAL